MSDDELDKLAAEMKNMRPSEAARKRGMDAAMKAFDTEFAKETENVKEAAGEKTSTPVQGSAIEPRHTSKNTGNVHVNTSRSGMMSKFKNVFSYNPRSAMLMGSCAAALIASFVILPNSTLMDVKPSEDFNNISAEMGSAGEEIVITGRSSKDKVSTSEVDAQVNVAPSETIDAAPPPVTAETTKPTAPKREININTTLSNGGINSVNDLLQKVRNDASVSANENAQRTENARREAEFRVERRTGNEIIVTAGRTAEAQQIRNTSNLSLKDKAGYVTPSDILYPEPRIVEPNSRDRFETYDFNPIAAVKEKPVSTFSIDVDTASYSFLRSSINRGQLPPRSSIRLEELINYFPYDYEAPTSADEPFKANVTVTPSPWNADTKLMHVGIKGYVPAVDEKPRSNIVFLIDTSGSMNQANKLPLLINSFKLLLNTLDEDDTVSIVTYAGSAGTVLEPTPATNKKEINAALNRLRAGGSTAGAAGLELAYNKAQESFEEDGVNRVILATDGDFNVGFSSPDEMKTFIEKKRKTGIFLSVLGFGNGNYNDSLMQSLAQNGNGIAAYIDSLAEANKVLADEAGSALITIAKDVKIQVEFNPATVSEYRLIGYETRALKRQDFNNDKVDAGEIGAGHSVTAIYELTPVGSPVSVDNLRYVSGSEPTDTGSDELAFVKIRHKLPNSDTSTLQTFPVGPGKERNMRRASDDMRFATAVAAVGQKLRGDTQLDDFSYSDAIKLASSAKGDDEHGYRAEFIQLVRLMESLDE